ncbi:LacI family transcriptional regulator [Methylobacterium sp. J-088]|uniref:LacI family DNA-binding transcriptional regulator n=1 Tax=Methylobacterium sp. J-088 TaxID=2836664 RepID=UPI001FBBF920|nr:LacI family DNA-binding transcriptional regulator [Methylobacterium sp. J-088]MCJ2066021.1 LacI family transcriptional regulator [Methylobacterium sp. J-088]
MPTKRVTSHDVARQAGVSRATVSLVLNRSESVVIAKETRERVLRAAGELGYKPNSAARMLVSGQSETIGLIVSDPSILLVDQFVTQVLYGVETANRQLGLHVLVAGLESDGPGSTYDDLVESRRIDGLIVLNPKAGDAALISLIEKDFPLVLVGSVRHPREVAVTFATRPALMKAVDHVVGLGHRRVGAITFSPRSFIATEARLAALEAGLRAHGLALDADAIEIGDFSPESGHCAGLALLSRRPDVTAIFAGNDTIAIGVLSAAHALGRTVPQDLSLVGFDDLPFAPWLTPALTTIRTDGVHQGQIATQMLFERLNGRSPAVPRVRLEPDFIVRASTGSAKP